MSGNEQNKKIIPPTKVRRKSHTSSAFEEEKFDLDVGSREHPEEKFLSYTKAKVKEALTKVRHVEKIGGGKSSKATVWKNGEVSFNGNKYKKSYVESVAWFL